MQRVGTRRANAPVMSMKDELRDRVEARKRELQTKLNDLESDKGKDASAHRDQIKRELEELETHLKEGWEKVDNTIRAKLGKWLGRK
jgi:hypothetical protein